MTDLEQLALPGVRGLRPYQPGKPAEELERELGIADIVKLASNENPIGAGRLATEVVRAGSAELHRYPDGNGHALRNALARKLELPAAQIVIGNGSNEILELVARAFVSAEHEVVFSQHAFAVYPLVTQAIGARAVVTPARDWGHDLEAMRAAVSERTRLIFIANPNNPTGSWLPARALEGFIASLPEHVIVVVDEAYCEYVTEADYPDASGWIAGFPRLLVTRTFSKIHGLAAVRLGYGLASEAMVELLNRVRQPFNVNALAQLAGIAALHDERHIERSRALNERGMQQLIAGFDRLGLAWIPSVGNFICVACGRDALPVYQALLEEGVIVRPVANYGMPEHLRVTVGLEAENARFLTALAKVLT